MHTPASGRALAPPSAWRAPAPGMEVQTQWSHNSRPPRPSRQTSGQLGLQPSLLSKTLPFTVEATHLPTSCPLLSLGWDSQQVQPLGTLRSGEGGNKAEQQVWVGVRDDLLVGPSYGAGVIGAPICWSKSLARPLGDVERNPAGTGGDAGTRRVTIEHPGASGAGKWKWFSQMPRHLHMIPRLSEAPWEVP